MIIGKIKDLPRYLNLHKNLDTAIHALTDLDFETLAMGKNIIDGELVYINRFDYLGQDETDCFFEGHRDYLDIHLVLSGKEYLGYSDISELQAISDYDETNDFIKYAGAVSTYCLCRAGDFVMVFPEDIHMPKISSTQESIRKCVVKVKVN